MQLFRTAAGVARRDGETLELLDVADDALHDAILTGTVADLARAASRGAVPLAEADLLVPFAPTRVIIVGLNYRSHAEEVDQPVPTTLLFAHGEPGQAIVGPGEAIELPAAYPDQVDYEAEIAVVIGRDATDVCEADAWDVVAGVTAANDLTARDLQMEAFARLDFTSAKLLPTFKPLGPGVITVDEARAGLGLASHVNGELRQQATDADMVFSIPQIVAIVSEQLGLLAGDVILTGSPAGVGLATGRSLRPGDRIEITVGDLPPLVNAVAAT